MANDYEARLADPANKWFHARILQHKTQETDDRLFIEGYASTPSVDRDDEIIDPIAFRDGIAAYMKNPILLFMHSPYEPVGGVISMDVDDAAGFYIKAFLSKADRVKDYATMVKERILRAFSVGFRPLNASAIEDGKRKITELELWEVSIVSIPSNRDALFSVAKALKWGNDIVVPQDKLLESLTSKIVTLEDVKKLLDERDKAREEILSL